MDSEEEKPFKGGIIKSKDGIYLGKKNNNSSYTIALHSSDGTVVVADFDKLSEADNVYKAIIHITRYLTVFQR